MSEQAVQKQYRQEFIAGFEVNESLLRQSTTTEAVIKGNEAVFLVADSGDAEAQTRGINGMIPARGDNLAQPSAILVEWHDLVRKTKFNVFSSQGNQREIMQKTTYGVVNRKMDSDITSQLNLATGNDITSGATGADLKFITKAKTKLGNDKVPWDGNIFAVISPGFEAALITNIDDFKSRDYTSRRPIDDGLAWDDTVQTYRWLDINWIVHPELPDSVGVGGAGSAEKCFMYHRTAIGHAYNSDDMETEIGYDREQAYSWCRCSIFMGSKLLQNSNRGVIRMIHNSTDFV